VHPHRGFETVTIVYAGEVAHRDSTGEGGRIGPGDVQWMTAGAGILHEEYHGEDFARSGGTLEMVQLWVNLPALDKQATPAYQAIASSRIPRLELPGGAGSARVIAGELLGHAGPARTFTPLNVWDLRLARDSRVELPVPEGWNTVLVMLHGSVRVNAQAVMRDAQVALFERAGNAVTLEAEDDAMALLLSGAPIDEPIVGYGPFVMNSEAEIAQAIDDYNSGRFGTLARASATHAGATTPSGGQP
jgi:quercetin 2,3-dioxygenase